PDGDLLRCTIHRDSPAQCKFYRCVVMRVYDRGNTLLGTVRGTLDLHTDDPGLRGAWDSLQNERPKDDALAESWLLEKLTRKGYRIE
ncbi:MAG: hypothetical protein GYA23_00065, partial [Methanomicrobiales archaeon]|nr:hypothetical protein [Methanomicrobiales archaeon]